MLNICCRSAIVGCGFCIGQAPDRMEMVGMAKTLKVRTTLYDVCADVVLKVADGTVTVVNFAGEGSGTKSVRALTKTITDTYKDDGYEVLAVTNIKTTKRISTIAYRVNATMQDIVNACIADGLDVFVVHDAQDDVSETETDKTDVDA